MRLNKKQEKAWVLIRNAEGEITSIRFCVAVNEKAFDDLVEITKVKNVIEQLKAEEDQLLG